MRWSDPRSARRARTAAGAAPARRSPPTAWRRRCACLRGRPCTTTPGTPGCSRRSRPRACLRPRRGCALLGPRGLLAAQAPRPAGRWGLARGGRRARRVPVRAGAPGAPLGRGDGRGARELPRVRRCGRGGRGHERGLQRLRQPPAGRLQQVPARVGRRAAWARVPRGRHPPPAPGRAAGCALWVAPCSCRARVGRAAGHRISGARCAARRARHRVVPGAQPGPQRPAGGGVVLGRGSALRRGRRRAAVCAGGPRRRRHPGARKGPRNSGDSSGPLRSARAAPARAATTGQAGSALHLCRRQAWRPAGGGMAAGGAL